MASRLYPTPCEMNVSVVSSRPPRRQKTEEKLKNPQEPNTQAPESQEGLKLSTERGGGFVAGVDLACPPRQVLTLGRPAASRRACTCLKLSEASDGGGLRAWERPAYRRLFRQPSLSFGKGSAIFSPQRSRPLAPRRGPLTEKLTQTRRLLAVYTGASSPSLFSSLLSALWAVGHVQANADAASNIAASASQARIFHRGLSLQRLAT